ncbi:M56 family metallopeptidase [Sediminibacillus halophilus]|uniref:Zn-dependent protease with chaperone function n=1 Tax=Sediminibacillus halophilus TaxID=482461 RepID=A0A1G9NLM5_9BACI|nr:M56 family metallopeptidase [Sediminibacillus halophilus]SDL86927.1 Zn-dependent protease with chaperone function [Sediminibacillus halophilus]
MLPGFYEIIVCVFLGLTTHLIGLLAGKKNKKLGIAAEGVAALLVTGIVFYLNPSTDGFLYFSFLASGWSSGFTLTRGLEKYREVKRELDTAGVEQIITVRSSSRIAFDLVFVIIVYAGAILFLFYGPKESPLHFVIVFGMFPSLSMLVKRVIDWKKVRFYYGEAEQKLYIISWFHARTYTLQDAESVAVESAVDLLKLHPYFTLFTSRVDFTTSMQRVLRIQFPGESVYMTVEQAEQWQKRLTNFTANQTGDDQELVVLPFYHRKNIKRLFGKLYFAMTVKGISAYTGLVLLLYFLKAPPMMMAFLAGCYWVFNLYISDRVLKTAMDAKEVEDPIVIKAARKVFSRAGIPNVKVYVTESDEYNGLAAGMNIGHSLVTLTSTTLKLPPTVLEGILAHEAVHVKKRDVMWKQIANALLLLGYVSIVFVIAENISDIEAVKTPLFFVFWLMFMLFPVFQSLLSQWCEVRADFLGSSYLDGGTEQMAESMTAIAVKQDEAALKSVGYSETKQSEMVKESSLDRSPWWLRVVEFQMMPHPPMYWRIQALHSQPCGWGIAVCKYWFISRWKESFYRKK